MGYGYAETFLVIFLTHPGVIIPTAGSAMSKLTSFVPGDLQDVIPKGNVGFPPIITALWQVMWAWILSLPGEKSAAVGWTMYTLYLFFLLAYMYFFVGLRMSSGV
jgi:hypothetical protein